MELYERVERLENELANLNGDEARIKTLEDEVAKIKDRLVEVDTMIATLHAVQKVMKGVINERLPDAPKIIGTSRPVRALGEHGLETPEATGG